MTTTVNPTQQIVEEIKGFGKRLEPMEDLLKLLQKRASATGLTPAELIDKATNGGSDPAVFGPDGNPLRFPWRKNVGGLGRQQVNGEGVSFGDFLKHLALLQKGGVMGGRHFEALQKMGVQQMREEDGRVIKTALAESSGVSGGYVVPPQFSAQLQMLALEEAVVPQRATPMPLTNRTLTIPSLDQTQTLSAGQTNLIGGVTASWLSEAQSRPESEPKFRQTTLTAWELAFYMIASTNLINDAEIAIDSLVTQLFSLAIGWYVDYAMLQGNGVGKPIGVLNAGATIQVSRAAGNHFRYSDIGQMLSRLYWPQRKTGGIVWVVSPSVIPEIWGMTDNSQGSGNGRLVFQPYNMGAQEPVAESAGAQSFGRLAGYPVLVSEKLPALGSTGDVMLMDFSKYLYGVRQDITIDANPYINWLTNQMTWRVIWRGDGQPWLNNAVTLADQSTKVSPFIVLT